MPRIFDVLLGRTKPVQANLDELFGLVSAQITLQAGQALLPTGQAGVCFKAVAGRSFAETAAEASQLLGLDDSSGAATAPGAAAPGAAVQPLGTGLRQEDDQYGFHWVVLTVPDFQDLVNQVHVVNSTLQDNGYGPQLLCSVFGFHADPSASEEMRREAPPIMYLVYLYKRGAFYPFIPLPGGDERRDVQREIVMQQVLADDLKVEPDKERWMPLWGLPVR